MKLSKPHDVGLTQVVYATKGEECYVVSAGTDGKLCLLDTDSLEVVTVVTNDDVSINALTFNKKSGVVFSADNNGSIKAHTLPSLSFESSVTNANHAVRCSSLSPSGSILALAGDQQAIKLVDVDRNKVIQCLGPCPSVRCIAYDPQGIFLAIVTAKGAIEIWDVQEDECVRKIKSLGRKVADRICIGVSWHPDGGTLLAVPGRDNDVVMLERLSWEEQPGSRLTGAHTKPVNHIVFSPNGLYAATAGEDNLVVVWDVAKNTAIFKAETPRFVTHLAWHPKQNAIVFGMDSGQIGKIKHPVPVDMVGPADPNDIAATTNALDQGGQLDLHSRGRQDDELNDKDGFLEERAAKRRRGDDGGVGSPAYVSSGRMLSDAPQKPVQPGATQPGAHDKPYYLCYNSLGFIAVRSMEDSNLVEVTINDPRIMHARVPKLHDFKGYSVGSIGWAGAVFASTSKENAPGVIDFNPFSSWATRGNWSVTLGDKEEAVCVAAGSSFVAAATNTCRLGIFGVGGVRQRVWSLEGAPVALCAHEDLLAVVWHGFGSGVLQQQNLKYMVYNCNGFQVVSAGTLALSPESILEWIGFSDEGILATYDSKGILRLQDGDPPHMTWIPVFEASNERRSEEVFRVIGVRKMAAVCIVCTPQNPLPQVYPPPVVTDIPLRISGFAPLDATLSKLENDHMLQHSMLAHKRSQALPDASEILQLEAGIDSTLLTLFHETIKMNNPIQAFHIATGICADKSLQGALALANHHSMVPLAEKLTRLLEDRMREQDDDTEHQAEEFAMKTNDPDLDTVPEMGPSDRHQFGHAQENFGVSVQNVVLPEKAAPSSDSPTTAQDPQKKSTSNPFARKT